MASLPWVEKYRPKALAGILSHGHIIKAIRKLVKQHQLPHLLFYGPPGTGKTSVIHACAKELYGEFVNSMVLELNASDDSRIETVRTVIKNFAAKQSLLGRSVKLVILDEADNLSDVAQGALRRVVEQYATTTRFCFICNYVAKLIPAIQSRCTRFRFAPIKETDMVVKTRDIAAAEDCNLQDSGLQALLTLSKGDMRKVLNVLEACAMTGKPINDVLVYTITGKPHPADMQTILTSLQTDTFAAAHAMVKRIQKDKGLALADVVSCLADLVETLPATKQGYLYRKLADVENALVTITEDDIQLGGLVAAFVLSRSIK